MAAYDSVRTYIQMNFDGLKDDIIRMLSGERVYVNTLKFQNDMHIVRSRNDVLTVLIHLGYLAYDDDSKQCYVPNKEVADEFLNAVEDTSWTRLVDAITASRNLLDATVSGNEQAVVRAIDQTQAEGVPFEDCRIHGRHPPCGHQLRQGDEAAYLQDRTADEITNKKYGYIHQQRQ